MCPRKRKRACTGGRTSWDLLSKSEGKNGWTPTEFVRDAPPGDWVQRLDFLTLDEDACRDVT